MHKFHPCSNSTWLGLQIKYTYNAQHLKLTENYWIITSTHSTLYIYLFGNLSKSFFFSSHKLTINNLCIFLENHACIKYVWILGKSMSTFENNPCLKEWIKLHLKLLYVKEFLIVRNNSKHLDFLKNFTTFLDFKIILSMNILIDYCIYHFSSLPQFIYYCANRDLYKTKGTLWLALGVKLQIDHKHKILIGSYILYLHRIIY